MAFLETWLDFCIKWLLPDKRFWTTHILQSCCEEVTEGSSFNLYLWWIHLNLIWMKFSITNLLLFHISMKCLIHIFKLYQITVCYRYCHVVVTSHGFWIDLLNSYNWQLRIIITLSLIHALDFPLEHTISFLFVSTSRCVVTALNSVDSSPSVLNGWRLPYNYYLSPSVGYTAAGPRQHRHSCFRVSSRSMTNIFVLS
jgi:hypothetical protein